DGDAVRGWRRLRVFAQEVEARDAASLVASLAAQLVEPAQGRLRGAHEGALGPVDPGEIGGGQDAAEGTVGAPCQPAWCHGRGPQREELLRYQHGAPVDVL